jgi:hypothetical protein
MGGVERRKSENPRWEEAFIQVLTAIDATRLNLDQSGRDPLLFSTNKENKGNKEHG